MSHRDNLLNHLRRVALQSLDEQRTDGELLQEFIACRDENAFALLLRRHGPMVRGVCRRILGDVHDADDAFQATFLVLVRKAESVRPREAVGNFLYGVAYRTALEARRRRGRRRRRETPLFDVPLSESESDDRWRELRPLLDREVNRLSEKYRLPVVLCELEGRSRKEVARQLDIPEGTLSSRLATARKKLAARLARYGFCFSAVPLTALLAEKTATAFVPASLSNATLKAAMLTAVGPAALGIVSTTVTTLTEGVLKTMFLAKLKTVMVVLIGMAALSLGTGGVVYQTRAGADDSPKRDGEVKERPKRRPDGERVREKGRRSDEEARPAERKRDRPRAEGEERKREEDRPRVEEERKRDRPRREKERKRDPLPEASADTLLKQLRARHNAVIAEIKNEIQMIEANRKIAEAKMRLALDEFDRKEKELLTRQKATPPKPPTAQMPAARRDKLDLILERLERMEKRLDRLERGRR